MMNSLFLKFGTFFKNDSERSQQIIKNVISSVFVKGGSIIVALLLVPMTINYISSIQYGIWLTISSIVSWMSFFDVGLGNGLRNNLSKAIAIDDLKTARVLISTTYAILTIISVALFVFFQIIAPYLDWRSFLNLPDTFKEDITYIILIVLSSFCVQFIVQILNTILTAIHTPYKAALISFIGQLGVLIGISIMKIYVPGSLSSLVWVLTLVPIVILIISSIYLFGTTLKSISPSINLVNFKYSRQILNTGLSFFLIQIGAMVLFQSNNIVITKVLGPAAVTQYNVVFKLFSVVTMIFNIVITPYWSAFTDAYFKKDMNWIKNNLATIKKVWLSLSFLSILLGIFSTKIFHFWVGDSVIVTKPLIYSMLVYVVLYMWQTLHVYFLNGIGRLKLQLIAIIISACANVPLAFYLGSKLGVPGVIIANSIVFLAMGILFSIQTKKILDQTDQGVWAK